jgi:hypothetical protein
MSSTATSVDDATAHAAIAQATNKRQDSKLLDIRSSNVLICERDSGISVTIATCDLGIHAIWTRRGTYCDDRHVGTGGLLGVIEGARKIGMEVQEIGNSEGVVIPADWREDLGISTENSADAEYDREERTVTFHF